MMKKFIFLFGAIGWMQSCDDGEITVSNPDFDSVTSISKCPENTLLYKIKTNDALLWNISQNSFDLNFVDDITLENAPREFPISEVSNTLVYRAYDGIVASTKICGIVPDAAPNVKEEWKSTSGIAEIVTTVSKTTNAVTGFEKITGFNHSINFRNLIFNTPSGTRTENARSFGTYTTTPTNSLNFNFLPARLKRNECGNSQTNLINLSGTQLNGGVDAGVEALILRLSATDYANLIKNEVTTTPRSTVLSTESTLNYQLFSGLITPAFYCNNMLPANVTLLETWIANSSSNATNGIIEVTTTTAGSEFEHTVILKNVTLKRGNTFFSMGTNYILGKFFTTL